MSQNETGGNVSKNSGKSPKGETGVVSNRDTNLTVEPKKEPPSREREAAADEKILAAYPPDRVRGRAACCADIEKAVKEGIAPEDLRQAVQAYNSRQSALHRANEKSMRSYALETQALDPFIASLKTTEQQAIKAELVRRMFGQQNTQANGKRNPSNDENIKTLLDRLPETVAGAIDKIANKS